jgi:hypothetical protein
MKIKLLSGALADDALMDDIRYRAYCSPDLAWDGHAAVFEHGKKLAETERFSLQPAMASRGRRSGAAPSGMHSSAE